MRTRAISIAIIAFLCRMLLPETALAQQVLAKANVLHPTKHDLSAPLWTIAPASAGREEEPQEQLVPLSFELAPAASGVSDPAAQTLPGPLMGTIDLRNFDGVGHGSNPPDTNGAAGETQFMQWVNSRFAVFDKETGNLVYGPVSGSTLFSGLGLPCESNHGDGIILYDKAAGRWFLSQLLNNDPRAPTTVCIAISSSSDATLAWYRYQFDLSSVLPPDTVVPDYPKFGVWPDGYYYTANVGAQDPSHNRTNICAYDRANMLLGNDATAQCFLVLPGPVGVSYLPADLDGSNPPAPGSPNFLVDVNNSGQELRLLKFHVDWDNPDNSTLSGPIHLPAEPFTRATGTVPQLGTPQGLNTLGDRVMFRLAYRNFGDHDSLVVNHSVQDANGVIGIRWYELRDPNGSPFLYQQGTFMPDASLPQATYRWMGSIAMDQAGNIALGYSASSSYMHPAIRYTGRTPDDPLGILEEENSIIEGGGSKTSGGRWGDYSAMTIDPVDDCTFWFTTEYYATDGGGSGSSTRIASFKFASCGSAGSWNKPEGKPLDAPSH